MNDQELIVKMFGMINKRLQRLEEAMTTMGEKVLALQMMESRRRTDRMYETMYKKLAKGDNHASTD